MESELCTCSPSGPQTRAMRRTFADSRYRRRRDWFLGATKVAQRPSARELSLSRLFSTEIGRYSERVYKPSRLHPEWNLTSDLLLARTVQPPESSARETLDFFFYKTFIYYNNNNNNNNNKVYKKDRKKRSWFLRFSGEFLFGSYPDSQASRVLLLVATSNIYTTAVPNVRTTYVKAFEFTSYSDSRFSSAPTLSSCGSLLYFRIGPRVTRHETELSPEIFKRV